MTLYIKYIHTPSELNYNKAKKKINIEQNKKLRNNNNNNNKVEIYNIEIYAKYFRIWDFVGVKSTVKLVYKSFFFLVVFYLGISVEKLVCV